MMIVAFFPTNSFNKPMNPVNISAVVDCQILALNSSQWKSWLPTHSVAFLAWLQSNHVLPWVSRHFESDALARYQPRRSRPTQSRLQQLAHETLQYQSGRTRRRLQLVFLSDDRVRFHTNSASFNATVNVLTRTKAPLALCLASRARCQ